MTRTSKAIGTLAALTTMGAALVSLQPAQAEENGLAARSFAQTNLVSDVPGLAKVTDPNLKNPWGTSTAPGLPIWVSDNNAGVATLYDGAGGTPFIHALDTSKRQARCIDLPMLAGRQDLWQLRLTVAPRGANLTVSTAGQTLAFVDTRDFRASPPVAPVATRPGRTASHHNDRTWLLFGAAALATILAASALSVTLRRRRSRLAPT